MVCTCCRTIQFIGRPVIKKLLPLLLLSLFCLTGCVGIPDGVAPVKGFDAQRYMGVWYEIARLDHSFERGLINVTATYIFNKDGSVKVINSGFDPERKRWKEVEGKAYFVEGSDVGRLKVSFFGPFYGGYNIIELDKQDYSYVLICGNDRSYLWILARRPVLDEAIKIDLVQKAKELGFNTDALIYVRHDNASKD
jgi:apolipoprotein D and lipocalin family protein